MMTNMRRGRWGRKTEDQEYPVSVGTGGQMHYPEWNYVWTPNLIFVDTLIYQGYGRGRSAAYFEFKRMSNETTVIVFLKDFEEMIPFMNQGMVAERSFTFCKRGQNYGCQLAKMK